MNLPANEILIDNMPYFVEMVGKDLLGNNLLGLKIGDEKRLVMARDQSPSDLVDTFWHEVLHAMFDRRVTAVLEDGVEESIISSLAPGIVQLLRDNPDWTEWAIKMGNDHCRRSSPVSSSLPNKE